MGVLSALGNFLFGKDPDIFDENGRVRHKFPDNKWEKWNDRLAKNNAYDWRKHGAKERIEQAPQPKK